MAVQTITKALIGAQDFHLPDGTAVKTFSRLASLGGTTTLNDVGYEVDALITYGNGDAFTKATIDAALLAIGTTNKTTLLLRPGTWLIGANTDWSTYTNVTFKIVPGAVISHGAFTVKFPTIETGAYTIFDGTGAITFAQQGTIGHYLPQWWGVVGDASTDNSIPLNAAITSVNASGGGTLWFAPGTYNHTGFVLKAKVVLQGEGRESVYLTYTPATGNGITGTPSYSAIKGMTLYNSSTTGWGCYFTSFSSSVFDDFGVQGAKSGIYLGAAINSILSRGGVIGQGKAVSGGIGIKIGDDDLGYVATTTTLKSIYASAFEKNILNHHCLGLVLENTISETALIALENRAQTSGSLYTEDIDAFTWSGGVHAYVAGEAVHGGTSGATGTVSAYTTAWAATGHMVLNSLVGTWVVGEDILDSGNTTIAVVAALGYSINDIGGDSLAPFGVNITPVNRPDGWSHIALSATASKLNWNKQQLSGLITANQSIDTITETDILFNQGVFSAMMVFDDTTGKTIVRTPGLYAVNVNVTIAATVTSGKIYYLRVYQDTGLIGLTQMIAPAATISNFKITYAGVHDLYAGDVIKATLYHDDTTGREILKDSSYLVEYTSISIVGL